MWKPKFKIPVTNMKKEKEKKKKKYLGINLTCIRPVYCKLQNADKKVKVLNKWREVNRDLDDSTQ